MKPRIEKRNGRWWLRAEWRRRCFTEFGMWQWPEDLKRIRRTPQDFESWQQALAFVKDLYQRGQVIREA